MFILVALVLPAVLWASGYALMRRCDSVTPAFAAVAALPVMGVVHGYAAFAAARLTAAPGMWNRGVLFLAAAVAIIGGVRAWRERRAIAQPLLAQASVYLLLLIGLCALPVYGGVGWWGDWWYYFEVAGRFSVANGDMHAPVFNAYLPAGRPLLLSWQMATVRSALSDTYWACQCLGMIYVAPLAGVTWLFLRQRMDGAVAVAAAVVVSLLPGLWWTGTMLWPKVPATVLLLLGWYAATKETPLGRRPQVLGWLLMAASLLSHVMPVSYVAAAGVMLVMRHSRSGVGNGLRTFGTACASAALVLAPWAVWLLATYSLADILQGQYAEYSGMSPTFANLGRWGGNLAFSTVPTRLVQALFHRSDISPAQSLVQGYMLNGFSLVLVTGSAAVLASTRRYPLCLPRARAIALVLVAAAVVAAARPQWAQPESIYEIDVLRPAMNTARFGVLLCAAAVAFVGFRRRATPEWDPVDPFWWVLAGTLLPPMIQPATWPMGILPSAMLPTALAILYVVFSRIGRLSAAPAWIAVIGLEAAACVTWYLTQMQRGAEWTRDANLDLKIAHGAQLLYDVFPLPTLAYGIAAGALVLGLCRHARTAAPH